MKVFVTGATGFVGTRLCRALAAAEHEVVGMTRALPPADEAVADVVYVTGDVTQPASLSPNALAGTDAVIHLVGIIQEVRGRGQTFEAVHVEGTQNLVGAARDAGVTGRFVYMSALGTDLYAPARYSRTKAQAEQAVKASDIPYTVFRPSIILGLGSEFIRQMEALIHKPPGSPFSPPFVPLPGNGDNKFQPVFIDDLVFCVVRCLSDPATAGQTYEIGGATTVTFNQLIEAIERHLGVKKPLLHLPLPLMFAAAALLEAVVPQPPITVDQLANLRRDNVCDNTVVKAAFQIDPLPFEQILARVYG